MADAKESVDRSVTRKTVLAEALFPFEAPSASLPIDDIGYEESTRSI
jgi:hypothetical protein